MNDRQWLRFCGCMLLITGASAATLSLLDGNMFTLIVAMLCLAALTAAMVLAQGE